MLATLLFATLASSHPLCPFDAKAIKKLGSSGFSPVIAGTRSALQEIELRYGKCLSADAKELKLENAVIPYLIGKDKKGRWNSIELGRAKFPDDTSSKLLASAKAQGATLVRMEEGAEIENRGQEKVSVGELVYILALDKYRSALKSGTRKKTDIVTLEESTASFSLGPLSHWPNGVPLTLESAAHLAFGSKDNVAGDLLLRATEPGVFTYADLSRILALPLAKAEAAYAKGAPLKIPEGALGQNPREPLHDSNALQSKIGWFHSLHSLCEAALRLKGDSAFEGQWEYENAPSDFNGSFPRTVAFLRLGKPDPKGKWVCAAVALPPSQETAYTWGRDLLDRAYSLGVKNLAPEGE